MHDDTDIRTPARGTKPPLSARDLCRLYGTTEPPKVLRRITKGPLTFHYSESAIRQIEWHGVEMIRGITWPIRDTSWGTYAPKVVDVDLVEADEVVSGRLVQSVDNGRLVSELYFEASEGGDLFVRLTLTPVSVAFTTNRAGLTVLHPIRDLAGAPVTVRHSDGTSDAAQFPRWISPDQPLTDIAGLSYDIGGCSVDIAFEGEVFEMEDQRNWSDASYKTYCVPLKFPFTYEIDRSITQSLQIRFSGSRAAAPVVTRAAPVSFQPTVSSAPAIGLALEDGWGAGATALDAVIRSGVSQLLVRVCPDTEARFLQETAELARQLAAEVDLELVLDDDLPWDTLEGAARDLAESGLAVARVTALRRAYLDSHQPSDPWPEGADPNEVARRARASFPNARIGGGMLTNFTEFNRCRPDTTLCDFITHASSAIVHAGDDLSVLETLEALPHIFASATRLGGSKPYRLGLVSIGLRSNPYGAAVAENPLQLRETMAREDPRHRGLFGAAWAVGVLAATGDSAIESLCLAAPTGPFGIVHAPQHYAQCGYDDGLGTVYPLFHVVRMAARLAGKARCEVSGLAEDLVGYAARSDGRTEAMIANVSDRPRKVSLAQDAAVAILDTESFDAAVCDAGWLASAPSETRRSFDLGAHAVAFVQSGI